MHSTSNLEDGYFGSGKVLSRSLNKHGKDKHSKEILEFLEDRISLKKREEELVNDRLINDPMCMNLQLGGGGGFINEAHFRKCTDANRNSPLRLKNSAESLRNLLTDPEYRKNFSKIRSDASKGNTSWLGLTHSNESKVKIGKRNSIAQLGKRNSQFGKMWIHSEELKISKSVLKSNIDQYLTVGWKIGRKLIY